MSKPKPTARNVAGGCVSYVHASNRHMPYMIAAVTTVQMNFPVADI